MTTPLTMTREDLLEYAALDAFGLLDEFDADRYTRAFHDAPTTVQDEVRRVQAELAIDPSLIAVDEEPPFSLRERVLAAVAAAIEREEAQLAPLATIGRGRHGEMDFQLQRARFASAGMFWRAASFVLAAGCILMAYAWSTASQQGNEIARLALGRDTEVELQKMIGPSYADFVNSATSRPLALRPVASDFPGQATIYRDDSEGAAFLVAQLLPKQASGQMYTLHVSAGPESRDVQFVSNGVVTGIRLENLSAALLASTSWQILNAAGEVVLKA